MLILNKFDDFQVSNFQFVKRARNPYVTDKSFYKLPQQ